MTYLLKNEKYALMATPEYPLGQHLKLYRLVAMRDIGADVKAGDQGGLVSGPMNLSDVGECWVYPKAMAHSGARVMDDALVCDEVCIAGPVELYHRSKVRGNLHLSAKISLGNDEVLESYGGTIVNLPLHRIGQFVKEGNTRFALEVSLDGAAANSYVLGVDRCEDVLAAFLCSRQSGDQVAFVQFGLGRAQLLPVQSDNSLSYEMVKGLVHG